MTYLLASDGFDDDGPGHFRRYMEYLQSVREAFPPSAFALASSEWYHTYSDHRCPHDSWLESVTVRETASDERHKKRSISIAVRLLGAYQDGYIELVYPNVHSYKFDMSLTEHGHRDWRYDELRLSDKGNVLHEIEWCGPSDTGKWLIEASDVEFRWLPKE